MTGGRIEQVGTPEELYRTPASVFVARFVGSMNQLPATVTGNDRVEVAGVTVPTWAAAPFGLGQAVTLLVRPEDVEVDRLEPPTASARMDGLVGSVVARTFAGAATLVQVRLDRARRAAHRARRQSPGPTAWTLGRGRPSPCDGGRALCESPEAAPAVAVEV